MHLPLQAGGSASPELLLVLFVIGVGMAAIVAVAIVTWADDDDAKSTTELEADISALEARVRELEDRVEGGIGEHEGNS